MKMIFILYFPSAGDVQSLPRKQNFSMHSSYLSDRHQNNECHYSSSFLWAFIAEQSSHGMEIPVVSLGQMSWLCSFLRFFPPPDYWWEAMSESCFSTAQQETKYWCVKKKHFNYLFKAQWYGDCYGKLIPSQLDPIHEVLSWQGILWYKKKKKYHFRFTGLE